MKIKTTKQEFVQMLNSLFAVKDLKGKKFAVAVAKNLEILTNNLKDLEEAGAPSKEFMELATQVNEIANKNEDGAKEQIDNIEQENKELIDARRAQLDDVAKLMEEEIEITIEPLTIEMLPEDITPQQMSSLLKFIK